MAKGAWIGIGGKAKKIKNMYIGIGGKAKKVKKAWIGVGGKAKLFWSGLPDTVTFNKTLPASALMSGTNVSKGNENHVCVRATTSGYGKTSDIKFINNSLTNTTLSTYNITYGCGVMANANYIFECCGIQTSSSNADSIYNHCIAYDSSLTKKGCTNATSYGGYQVTGRIGNYAFRTGGSSQSTPSLTNKIDTYDTSLAKGTSCSLSTSLKQLRSGNTSDYQIFWGGYTGSGYTQTSNLSVNAFNASLTRTTSTLSTFPGNGVCAWNNEYVIIAGSSDVTSTYVLNNSLTLSTTTALTRRTAAGIMASGSPGVALFAGGYTISGEKLTPYNTVETYDTSLTKTSVTTLPQARGGGSAATLNNKYFLIIGGRYDMEVGEEDTYYDYYNRADVYNIT